KSEIRSSTRRAITFEARAPMTRSTEPTSNAPKSPPTRFGIRSSVALQHYLRHGAKFVVGILLLGLLTTLRPCFAAEPTREQLDFFENKIRPVLSQSCYQCHSVNSEKVKGGLLLDSREATLKGGENGPAV